MELYDILLNTGLITAGLVAYLIFFRRSSPAVLKGPYRQPAWNYPLRLFLARIAVKRWKSSRAKFKLEETPLPELSDGWDCVSIRACGPGAVCVLVGVRRVCARPARAEATVHLRLADGAEYSLPQHPETSAGAWQGAADGWRAGGLRVRVLEPAARMRVTYAGPLTRAQDGHTEHVTFSFIWASASSVVRHPEDWSDQLAAQALALEPWRDDQWPHTLGKCTDGSWYQWGALQGRVSVHGAGGGVAHSEWVRARGVRERRWAPRGYRALRRALDVTALAGDGTAVHLRGFSYKDVLTVGYCGSVRFPDSTVQSITSTNLEMADFCEDPDGIPQAYTINVSTKSRDLKLVLRPLASGRRLLSGGYGGGPRHLVVFRALSASVDGHAAAGVLELGYEATGLPKPVEPVAPPSSLRWVSEREAGAVRYCVPLEARGAACPALVGGKGASLALLASVQHEQDYRVPPGFCLTTRALERHLQSSPSLRAAVQRIEDGNERYDEAAFRDECNKAVELFEATEIESEVRDEILNHLTDLRKKAIEQNFGPDLLFAVRSSALGEDGEALSAAGQNATVLGCARDGDVLRGVRACWGSLFAFTSAHYRRTNGQACQCGAGVVVQVLARARCAGVLFTRHPQTGDAAQLIITANYGLGETVVSGTVEPDTVFVSVGAGGEVSVSRTELGSKRQRAAAGEAGGEAGEAVSGGGVRLQDVSEAERGAACLTPGEALRLARVGVAQDALWGAARDIEWAIVDDAIFLLQARPLTSLERWSEEELLHELDYPLMADDELITFANTGEVMPRPLTALSHDLVAMPMSRGIDHVMPGTARDGHDSSLVITHNRAALALYNSIYRRVPKHIDVTLRMIEMAVHGHRVADARIHATALHRRPYSTLATLKMQLYTVKYLWTSKSSMTDTIRIANHLSFPADASDPLQLADALLASRDQMYRCAYHHANTTSASASSQFISMMVLLEGAEDFSPEQSSEMNTLLSAGGVLSAEVPHALGELAGRLQRSGRADEFRAQPPARAKHWLSVHLPDVHRRVEQFLEQHGHRAVMEFDLSTKPWSLVPEEMMQVLQNMQAPIKDNPTPKTNAEIIASLKTPKKSSTRRVLSWLLPLCQRTVRHRENTKAHLILAVHRVRLAARRLARELVRRWYLPDEDLVFHFRAAELRQYITTRDPDILKKASQRRQYYASWCKLRFAELNSGWVQPLASVARAVSAGDVRVEGTSVCGGQVVARACVITDLAEIGQLQQGDVLITHSTDIGWSPYFPLLAGIVTELGGLISHGAVIARECGLPCVVGARGAADALRTGDTVRLDATAGTLERVTLLTGDDTNT